jgi:hypothetical protein
MLRRWFLATTCGEFVGFGVPAVVGAVAFDLPLPAEAAALIAAGAVEGALLGIGQGVVVRRALPLIGARQWTLATAVGGAAAWAIAMSGVALIQSAPPVVVALAAPVLGAGLLLSIGTAQWWLLRRQVPRAWRWIAGTAAAWVTALVVFTAVTTPLWQPGQSIGLIVLIGVLGGLVMAATMAAITGWAFVRLVTRAPASGGPSSVIGPPLSSTVER